MNDVRLLMMCDYLDELAMYGMPHKSLFEKIAFYKEVKENDYTQWIDIKNKEKLIGFLIVGQSPNCHPDADFYIEEAYVQPEYRRQQMMSTAVSKFIKKHEGVYCMFVLNKNESAKKFWENAFHRLDYQPCYLRDVGAGDKHCTQFGYKPNCRKSK